MLNSKQLIAIMTHPSSSPKVPFGAARLCQDFATLINNRQGSDIQFKVGGGRSNSTLQENGETIYDESSTVTLYAHSLILRCRSRYFSTMLDKDKNWKENSNGIIYKPNISPSTFQDVLHYIYTGNVRAENSENIIELITAADEMDLEELSTECQLQLICTVKYIFSDGDEGDDEKSRETFEGSAIPRTPIDVAIRTHVIPALNLASSHSLSVLSQKLQAIILPHMSVIIKSPNAYTEFINGISSEALAKVISSDDLAMSESSIWDLVIDWGCNQTKLSKDAVETRLNSIDDDEVDEEELPDETLVSFSQLNLLKETLSPLLPFVRFSLLEPEDYSCMTQTLSYFLPLRRFSKLAPFIYNPGGMELPDKPRKRKLMESGESSKIINDSTVWGFLRKTIFEAGGITGCSSLKHLKFELLFRASEHGFGAATFHQRCDNKGPTLVLVKSTNGYLFGGVNFEHWKSDRSNSSSPLNFLFALPDGYHRKIPVIFTVKKEYLQWSSYNYFSYGPTFGGGYDLYIADSSNVNDKSYSNMPNSYEGSGASSSALAGAQNFRVSDYEVFAISKK